MSFIGIDPGFDGGMAVVDTHGNLMGLYDTPTLEVSGGSKTKRRYNLPAMVAILSRYQKRDGVIRVALEDVHSMPKQGVASSFVFGRGLGVWEGILAALQIPVHMISPQKWKKAMMDGMGKDKDASRVRALELCPAAITGLNLKKHHGRADALLMALYLRQIENGRV